MSALLRRVHCNSLLMTLNTTARHWYVIGTETTQVANLHLYFYKCQRDQFDMMNEIPRRRAFAKSLQYVLGV